MNPELALRTAGFTSIAGVDEAGRGAYAGPIVIAAVILNPSQPLDEVGDSKSFSEEERARIAQQIKERALSYAIISIDAAEIDTQGLQPSNIGGMRRAITALSVKPDYVITDGYRVEGLEIPSLAMWRGDQVSPSVGAASILAKNFRDSVMIEFDKKFPGYGFAEHKGYGTSAHQRALEVNGITSIHRKSFAPIAKLINAR